MTNSPVSYDASQKQRMINHFFKGVEPSSAGGGVTLIVLGSIGLLLGIGLLTALEYEKAPGGAALFVGLLFLIIGISVVASRASAKKKFWAEMPSRHQLDEWLKEDIERLKNEARMKLGIEESELAADPIFFMTPLSHGIDWSFLDSRIDSSFYLNRARPKMGINWPVPSSHQLEYVFLTDQIVHIYKTCWSQLYDKKSYEETEEYYLKDVLSVSTETMPLMQGVSLKTIMLKLPGTEVRLSNDESDATRRAGDILIPTTPMDKTVAAIKTLVKSAKT